MTIACDLDGVVHQYSRGWYDGTIYDPPMPGAIDGLRQLMKHEAIFIHTTRDTHQTVAWLHAQGLPAVADSPVSARVFWDNRDTLLVTNRKLAARAYLDDRAIRFVSWDQALRDLLTPADTHRCDNCDGIDPDNCLTNPDRPRTSRVDQAVCGVQAWMALDLHMALGRPIDHSADVQHQGHDSWADWWADLCAQVRQLAKDADAPLTAASTTPPGSPREQLPAHLLALIDIPPYTSTACETADLLTAAITQHPEHAEELQHWADYMRIGRCRINHKFTGSLCESPHHQHNIAKEN